MSIDKKILFYAKKNKLGKKFTLKILSIYKFMKKKGYSDKDIVRKMPSPFDKVLL